MKKLFKAGTFKTVLAFMFLTFLQVVAFAQDKVVTTTKHTETYTWYAEPWVWVVGGIVLILLLVAIFSGKNKTIVTNTTTRTIE